MRVLRAGDHREMPWKNGGGTTTEIAVFPAGAGLDAFDWRVSMARVESGGPFSLFPGIDRTLALLDGDGINLTVGGAIPVALTARSEPLPFPADVPTHATLTGGPVTDLNVMTRRGRVTHSMERVTVSGSTEIEVGDDTVLLFCMQGDIAVTGEKPLTLATRDALLLGEETAALRLESAQPAAVFLIRISGGSHAR
jgi:environmental stress-induced protein Ves